LRRFSGIATLAICVLVSTASAEPEPEVERSGKITANTLKVRSGPGIVHKTSIVLKKGQEVQILEEKGKWLRISFDDERTGWVFAKDVEVEKDAEKDAEKKTVGLVGALARIFGGDSAAPRGAGSAAPRGAGSAAPRGAGSAAPGPEVAGPQPDSAFSPRAGRPSSSGPSSSRSPVINQPLGEPNPDSLVDRSLPNDQQYQKYKKMVLANGGTVSEQNGQRTVIGLRGVNPSGQIFPEAKRDYRSYTDSFVVIWKDSNGQGHVAVMLGSTTPGQASTNYSGTPDANRDGVRDIAHLSIGTYSYTRRSYKGQSAYGTGGSQACTRDTNHNGRADSNEIAASRRRGDKATGILFHRGFNNRPSSVGCQTMSSSDFARFEQALGGQKNFSYTLIDVR
jgi:uncharacterized protein YgiM (DUF1202 family)